MDIVPFFVFLTWLAGWLAGRLVGFLVWWFFFHFLHWHHPPNPPHPRSLDILYIPHPPTHIHTPGYKSTESVHTHTHIDTSIPCTYIDADFLKDVQRYIKIFWFFLTYTYLYLCLLTLWLMPAPCSWVLLNTYLRMTKAALLVVDMLYAYVHYYWGLWLWKVYDNVGRVVMDGFQPVFSYWLRRGHSIVA